MKIDAARAMVSALESAIQQAEAEGRDELMESDLPVFVAQDDAARAALAAAIAKAE